MARPRVALLVGLVVLVAACGQVNWGTVGFDASRSSVSSDGTITVANVGSLTPRWTAGLATSIPSEPVVAGGRVFVTATPDVSATTGALAAFDAAGATNCTPASPAVCTPLWSVSFPPGLADTSGPTLSAPAVNGANVLIGTVALGPSSSTSMQAFTAATGKSVFATVRGGQRSPVVTGGHLYASVTDVVHTGLGVVVVDYLATFNATDGGEQFVDTTGHFGRPSAQAVVNGVLYATDGALEVYDAAGVTNCGPQYAPLDAQGHVFAPQWCGPLWTGSPAGSGVLPAVANGSVYVAGGAGTLSIFAAGGCGATTCSPRWTGNAGSQPLAPPAVTGRSVFVGSNDGHLYVFPAGGCGTATCAATWTASLGAAVNEPSVAGSVLFVTTRDGHLYAFNAAGCGQSTCSPLLSISVGNVIPGAAAISGGRVFVTDFAGILHAYALP